MALVIAHRGACGYLPEHTLEAKVLAFGQGADFLEQDVVLTRDNHPIVLHDIHLDTVTDVAEIFSQNCRSDGRYYALDFTLDQIRQLTVHERIDLRTGQAVFPARFPRLRVAFRIPTLAEEIALIQGLQQSTGRAVGIYPEVKAPAWHRQQGRDISRIVLDVLAQHGYRAAGDRIFVQCFDPHELRRIRHELDCPLSLVQLIGEDEADQQLQTDKGLAEVAQYAQGIGPRIEDLFLPDGHLSPLPGLARRHGLLIHPYTFRVDAVSPPAESAPELLEMLFQQARIDGLFTDFPDYVIRYLQQHE